MARMRIGPNPDSWFGVAIVAATNVLSINYNGSYEATYGLRPVFTLKDEVKVTGGSGTQDDPYTLGV